MLHYRQNILAPFIPDTPQFLNDKPLCCSPSRDGNFSPTVMCDKWTKWLWLLELHWFKKLKRDKKKGVKRGRGEKTSQRRVEFVTGVTSPMLHEPLHIWINYSYSTFKNKSLSGLICHIIMHGYVTLWTDFRTNKMHGKTDAPFMVQHFEISTMSESFTSGFWRVYYCSKDIPERSKLVQSGCLKQ